MKKILLGLCAAFLTTGSFAQNFTTEFGDTSTAAIPANDNEVKIYNRITNTSTSSQTYTWKSTGNSFPTGWIFDGVCDNNLCYVSGILAGATKVSSPVQPDSVMDFHAVISENGAPNNSMAWVRVSIGETGALGGKTLTFIATKNNATGVSVVKAEGDIAIYPNPATTEVNIWYNADLGVKNIGVYNLIGKMVSIYKVGNTSAKLDVDNLPAGIYFVRLFNAQGNVVATRKFTHQ